MSGVSRLLEAAEDVGQAVRIRVDMVVILDHHVPDRCELAGIGQFGNDESFGPFDIQLQQINRSGHPVGKTDMTVPSDLGSRDLTMLIRRESG